MGLFNFVRDCIDFLEDAWNRFTDWLSSLVKKIINLITSWLNSIIDSLEYLDFILTDGINVWVTPSEKVKKGLQKRGLRMEEMTSDKKVAIFDEIIKEEAEQTYTVPLNVQEKEKWRQETNNEKITHQLR